MLVWDAFNRLVGVARNSDGAPIAQYFYLPDGRRSRKVVYSQSKPGVVEKETRFVWDGAQEVEEQSAAGVTLATFVWSPVYVDELVEYRREAAHPLGAGSFYAHQDARCDVVAVTNASGVVVEKRRYDDFGREEIRDAGGAVVAASPSGLEYGFQGRRVDRETGFVYFRARFYDPGVGRFLSRDPVWDAGNVGGWYSFAGNGPVSGRDPFGDQASEAKRYGPDMPPFVDPSAGPPAQGLTIEEKAAIATAAAVALYFLTRGRTPPPPGLAPAPLAPLTPPAPVPPVMPSPRGVMPPPRGVMPPPGEVVPVPGGLPKGPGLPSGPGLSPGRGLPRGKQWTCPTTRAGAQKELESLIQNPEGLRELTTEQVTELARTAGWNVGPLAKGSHAGEGLVVRELLPNGQPSGRMVQFHPGGGHHGASPYWKTSSGTTGTQRVPLDPGRYNPDPSVPPQSGG